MSMWPFTKSKRVPRGGSSPIGTTYVAADTLDIRRYSGLTKWRQYSRMVADVPVVAASIRYFLNLAVKSRWSFEGADTRFLEAAERALMEDPRDSWPGLVRRAVMYRFNGFSLHEWTMRRREDGVITFAEISHRAPATITDWRVDRSTGEVLSIKQGYGKVWIPRRRCLYLREDALSDAPEGLGVFRHLVEPVNKLKRYQQLEGILFETNLAGVPIARAPLARIKEELDRDYGSLSEEARAAMLEQRVKVFSDFIQGHIRTSPLGMVLDSAVYESADDTERPSREALWSVDLLRGDATGLASIGGTVVRISREIARILGTEQLTLGEDSTGSFALAQDKTRSFFLLVDSVLAELAVAVRRDLLRPLWLANGWSLEQLPFMRPEATRFNDVEEVAKSLQLLAAAGAPLSPDDPAVNDVRDMAGLTLRVGDDLSNANTRLDARR